MPLPITALYAGLAGLLLAVCALRVPPLRYRLRQSLGDGGHAELQRAVRLHGNAAEHIPIALILLGLVEGLGGAPWLLHLIGGSLLLGRLLHALALWRTGGPSLARGAGMILTFTSQLTGAVACLVLGLGH
jgi:uncharacterized membrane protein YecN with MAPEG domain